MYVSRCSDTYLANGGRDFRPKPAHWFPHEAKLVYIVPSEATKGSQPMLLDWDQAFGDPTERSLRAPRHRHSGDYHHL
jgi:hypothetical protein